jgi:hypothetical protein
VSHNVTVPNPAIQSGFTVSLFGLPSSAPPHFDSGVLPLAPVRNPVLPLLSTLTAHSPPQGLLPCAVSPQPAQPDIHRLISRLLFRIITQVATLFAELSAVVPYSC